MMKTVTGYDEYAAYVNQMNADIEELRNLYIVAWPLSGRRRGGGLINSFVSWCYFDVST